MSSKHNTKQFLIRSDNTTKVGGDLANLKVKFDDPIRFDRLKNYKVELTYLKIPNTVFNISAIKGNNTFRYNYGAVDYDITFLDGIYSGDYLSSTIQAYLDNKGHYDTQTDGSKLYYFRLGFNNSLGKSFFIINKAGLTITFPSSTFYSVLGFNQTDIFNAVGEYLSTSLVDITQSTESFNLYCSICRNNVNSNKNSQILYNSIWRSPGHSYSLHPAPEEKNVIADLSSYDFSHIDIRFLDNSNNLMVFSGSSADSIELRLSIWHE